MTGDFETDRDNWAAWARSNTQRLASCRSLESHYKAPPMWEYPELKAEINILDAVEVEKVLTAPTFPKTHMACIVYAYVYPWRPLEPTLRVIYKRFGKVIRPDRFQEFLALSNTILKNRLYA